MFGEGGPTDNRSIELATKRGTRIPNERKYEKTRESLLEGERIAHELHPTIATRSLTGIYNCVGMALACRRTVVLADQIDNILREDGFAEIAQAASQIGDIVVYSRTQAGPPEHIGVVHSIDPLPTTADLRIMVLSQWGFDGEFIHRLKDLPSVYGSHVKFFTDRKRP